MEFALLFLVIAYAAHRLHRRSAFVVPAGKRRVGL